MLLVVSIAYLWLGNVLGMNLRPILLMLERLKEWVMLDIYWSASASPPLKCRITPSCSRVSGLSPMFPSRCSVS